MYQDPRLGQAMNSAQRASANGGDPIFDRVEIEEEDDYQQRVEREYAKQQQVAAEWGKKFEEQAKFQATPLGQQQLMDMGRPTISLGNVEQYLIQITHAALHLVELAEESGATSKSGQDDYRHRDMSVWSTEQLLSEIIERENGMVAFYVEFMKRAAQYQELTSTARQQLELKFGTMAALSDISIFVGQVQAKIQAAQSQQNGQR
jgi:hypothetical protein